MFDINFLFQFFESEISVCKSIGAKYNVSCEGISVLHFGTFVSPRQEQVQFPAFPVFETLTMEEMNFELIFDEDMMWDDYGK